MLYRVIAYLIELPLLFQFKDVELKNQVLSEGPWFYNNAMLVLADYDGVFAFDTMPLHLLERKEVTQRLSNDSAATEV
ncbi:hypothetical protein ACLB2K_020624 [Fragaria x ananassa]